MCSVRSNVPVKKGVIKDIIEKMWKSLGNEMSLNLSFFVDLPFATRITLFFSLL